MIEQVFTGCCMINTPTSWPPWPWRCSWMICLEQHLVEDNFDPAAILFDLQLQSNRNLVGLTTTLWNKQVPFVFHICMIELPVRQSTGEMFSPLAKFFSLGLNQTSELLKQHQCLWVTFLCLFHSDPSRHTTGPALHPAADPPWLHLWLKPGGCTESPLCVREECVFSDFFWKTEAKKKGGGCTSYWDKFKSWHVIYASFVGRILWQ